MKCTTLENEGGADQQRRFLEAGELIEGSCGWGPYAREASLSSLWCRPVRTGRHRALDLPRVEFGRGVALDLHSRCREKLGGG